MKNQWRYYNHALIPAVAPHESVDGKSLNSDSLWNNKKVLFARWTSDYDCGHETNWWYCIKDEPFDIQNINAKKRYEINKGIKNFEVKPINPLEYSEELFNILTYVANTYSSKQNISKQAFLENLEITNMRVFGAFDRETNLLCGYAFLIEDGKYIKYESHKAYPDSEKKSINAAIVNMILEYYENDLLSGSYICDGERNIYHETRFQDYLEKYFGFRKAYCKLNIKYKPVVKITVNILYPFKKIIYKISSLAKVGAVLKMHELYKTQIKEDK